MRSLLATAWPKGESEVVEFRAHYTACQQHHHWLRQTATLTAAQILPSLKVVYKASRPPRLCLPLAIPRPRSLLWNLAKLC